MGETGAKEKKGKGPWKKINGRGDETLNWMRSGEVGGGARREVGRTKIKRVDGRDGRGIWW